jgi:hypothetical protein
MEIKDQHTLVKQPERVLQFKVRSDLRGGQSLESCQKGLQDWQDEYYRHYDTVQDKLNA